MKIIKKGNVYKKANWFKQNECDLYLFGSVVIGFFCFVFAVLIRG